MEDRCEHAVVRPLQPRNPVRVRRPRDRRVVLGEDLGDVAVPPADVAVEGAAGRHEARHPAGAPPRARAVRLPCSGDAARGVDVVAVLMDERVRVRLCLGGGDGDHAAAVAACSLLSAPLGQFCRCDEIDPNRRDLVCVGRGAKQRGVPLHVDGLVANLEPDRAALVVGDDDLRSRLAGVGERKKRGDEHKRAAHRCHGSRPRSRFRKAAGSLPTGAP